jgi:hypothetical protein
MHSKTPDILAFPSTSKQAVLSQSQLDTLKAGILHVLEGIGVRFPSQKALEIFADHSVTAPLHECHAGLTNTLKHVRGGTTVYPELVAYLVEMAELGDMIHCVTQQHPLGKVSK